jgi:uncharacterized NAD-dependent epimerase/dehydratase family protein
VLERNEAEVILIEGQSSLRNPSGPCGLEFLISGQAKHVILVHAPKRTYFDNEPHWGKIPSVESEIEIIEKFGSKVIALALNTEDCSEEEAFDYQYITKINYRFLCCCRCRKALEIDACFKGVYNAL